MQLCLPPRHRGSLKLNSCPLSLPDWALWKMDPLSVGLAWLWPQCLDMGMQLPSLPCPQGQGFWMQSFLLASTKDRSLDYPPGQGLFHGESSVESPRFRMPNSSLALPGPWHMSSTCASCFSLFWQQARAGTHSGCVIPSQHLLHGGNRLLPPPFHSWWAWDTASRAEGRLRNGDQITEVGQAGGWWGVLCVEVVGQETGQDFSVPLLVSL